MKEKPKVTRLSIAKAVEVVLSETCVRKATVFQHPNLTVVAERRHKPRKNDCITEVLLTIGSPNFKNRQMVKDLLQAEEPFPVKRVFLEFWPRRK
jgi:hypothetical protein